MVAVPADAAADVQQDLVEPHEHGRDLVGDRLGGMEVAGVEAEQLLVAARRSPGRTRASRRRSSPSRCRTACSRRRRGCSAGIDRLGEDLVERLRPAARAGRCGRSVTSFKPSGIQTLVTQGVPSAGRSPRRSCGRRCRARPRTGGCPRRRWASVKPSAALGCEKKVGLKSMPMPSALGPVDPAAKVLGLDLVALDAPAAGLAVDGVQVEAVRAGDRARGPARGRRAARPACGPCRGSCR